MNKELSTLTFTNKTVNSEKIPLILDPSSVENILNGDLLLENQKFDNIIELIELGINSFNILYLVKIFDINDKNIEKIQKTFGINYFGQTYIGKILKKYKTTRKKELITKLFNESKDEKFKDNAIEDIKNERELKEIIDLILITNYKCSFNISSELQKKIIEHFRLLNGNLNYLETLIGRDISGNEFNIILNKFLLNLKNNINDENFYIYLLHVFEDYDFVYYIQKFYKGINKDIIDDIYNNLELYIKNSYDDIISIYLKFALAIGKKPKFDIILNMLKNNTD